MTLQHRRTVLSRLLTPGIVTFVLVGLALGAFLLLRRETVTERVGAEGYKALLQFITVAVLGGGLSLVYQMFNREADRKAQRARAVHEARQLCLRESILEYNQVKRARRMLRAQALTHRPGDAEPRVRIAAYDEHLQVVLDAQLAFETMGRVMEADHEVFPPGDHLDASLHKAETYLGSLVTEYEGIMPRLDQADTTVALSRLELLGDFIGPYKKSEYFRYQFVHPMRDWRSALQRLIINGS